MRERECHRLGHFALPLFVSVLLPLSHTLSTALHIFDALQCLSSQHSLSGTVCTCLSFPWQWPFLRYRFATWRRHCHLLLH